VNVSAATVHARTGLPDGTSPYELIIRVNIIHNSLIYTYSSQPATVNHFFPHFVFPQDTLPAAGFKTYFVRTVSDRSNAQDGAKVTTISPTKNIPRNIQQDVVLENDVM
jgi:hypothetical protein